MRLKKLGFWKKIYWGPLFVLFLSLGACRGGGLSPSQDWESPNGKVKILSTTQMIDDVVGQIGGDRVDHICLIEGEIDPHSYELVKGDDEKIGFAQLFFYNGLGLEHGASLHYQIAQHPHAVDSGIGF